MKDNILKLRSEGKTYLEITKILNCAISTVCYYCGHGQKDKTLIRSNKSKNVNTLVRKLERFRRVLSEKSRDFQRRQGSKLIPREEYNFTYKDILEKIGEESKCYLTGRV